MRCDNIIKCFKTVEALKKPRGVTAKELSSIINASTRTAYRYIQAASLVLPVFEHGGQPHRYELTDKKDITIKETGHGHTPKHKGAWRQFGSLR